MDSIAIAGVGEADLTRPGRRSSVGLHAEAALRAVEDAGLTWDQIDGVLTGPSLTDPHYMYSSVFLEYMGIKPRIHASVVLGGATPCAMLAMAASAVRSGECTNCLVVYADNRGSGGDSTESLKALAQARDHEEFERPYGMPAAGAEAMLARRHMYQFGTTREQLAQVAVTMSRHAALNPAAKRSTPLTVVDVLESKVVATPLRALDCALVTDFGGALVVTTAERARDLAAPPVNIAASCSVPSHKYISQTSDIISFSMRRPVDAMLARAGVSREDIDVAMIYDGFTISVILTLEACGFCPAGEGGPFVADGNIDLGGKLPTNTHGGMLSAVHGGVHHVIEAVRQLRGDCDSRQVPNARVAFVHGDGASQSTHSLLVLTAG